MTSTVSSVAHIASGGGWKTTVVLVNTGGTATKAHLNFFGDDGGALTLPLMFTQVGEATSAQQVDRTVAANASLIIESVGPDVSPAQVGSMQLASDANIGGYVIFRYMLNGQEASAPFESLGTGPYVIPFDHTGGIVTGTAVSSISTQPVSVSVILRDDSGNQIGTGQIALAANGHQAFSLAEQFPVTVNKRGSVEFNSLDGGPINVIGIRTPPSLTFTTLPPTAKQ